MSNNLIPTHLDRFPPSMFGNTTMDLMKKSEDLGVSDEDSMKELNVKRYMRNLDVLQADGLKLAIMPIQTEEMVLTALYQNMDAFRFVTNQTPAVCEMVLAVKPEMIKFFKVQTDEQIEYLIDKAPSLIPLVREPKPYQLEMCLDTNWRHIIVFKVEWLTEDIIKYAINKLADGYLRTKEIPMPRSLKGDNPLTLNNRKNQTQELVNYALSKIPALIVDVQEEFLTQHAVESAIDISPTVIRYLPISFRTKDNVMRAIKGELAKSDLKRHIDCSESASEMVRCFHPNDWNEALAIEIMEMFKPYWKKYVSLANIKLGEITVDFETTYCTPSYYVPTVEMIRACYRLGYTLRGSDITLDYQSKDNPQYGEIIYKEILRYDKSFKLDNYQKSARRWWLKRLAKLNLV